MKKLSAKETVLLSIALFSMFFGSGNLIFPPWMGFQAGNTSMIALLGFSISAIIFPVLGVVAIAQWGGLVELSSNISHKFALCFSILAFSAIGPGLAIPRNAAVSFEMAVIPFTSNISTTIRILYSVIFFAISYYLSLYPEKLMNTLGKILGPILIIMMILVTVGCFIKAPHHLPDPSSAYKTNQLSQGFMDGYNTMDTIAALNFGAIISMNVRAKGIKDEKSVISSTISAGWIAGFFLFIIYTGMTLVGALSAGLFQNANNGANVLSNIVYHLFGTYGLIALAIIYILSCLTTCIGLLCSCSEFFSSISKIAYKKWITLFTIISCVVSIFGLDQILTISVPILTTIYPVAMVLVILGLLKDKMQRYPNTYPITIYTVTIISIIYSLNSINIQIPFITNFILSFPPNKDLCWLIPSIIAFMIGMITSKKKMH